MNNASAILRSLIVYAICVPLAIVLGYLLSSPLNYTSISVFGALLAVLVFPILMRWHYPLLLFSWSAGILLFIIPGNPNLWVIMVPLSLGISVLERLLTPRMHFIRVPSITWPLLAIVAVVVFTAEMTGGIGLRAFGSAIYGGKKYVMLFLSIASYFALTSRRIPLEKAGLFVALFFLGRLTAAIGDFYRISPSWLRPLFYVFQPSVFFEDPFQLGVTRLGGVGAAALGGYFLLISRYGIRGIFMSGKLWRPVLLVIFFVLVFMGGFRSAIFLFMASFIIMFFLEGLHRTLLAPAFGLLALMGCVAIVPLAHKLPFTFQRALAFLPLDLDVRAKASANESTEWRLRMWDALLPQIPSHLLLGKGYAFSAAEYEEMMKGGSAAADTGNFDASQSGLALAGDYHNAMLGVVLPFGIWGVLAFLWFLGAGLRVMYLNFKYGDPCLRIINQFLFTLFFIEFGSVVSCVGGGSLAGELGMFISYLGLSIAVNNGVCQPARQTIQSQPEVNPEKNLLRLRPFLQP